MEEQSTTALALTTRQSTLADNKVATLPTERSKDPSSQLLTEERTIFEQASEADLQKIEENKDTEQ